jgi:integrase
VTSWYNYHMPRKIKTNRQKHWPRGVLAWYPKSGRALLEVIIPDADGKKRRRREVTVASYLQLSEAVLQFRKEVAQAYPGAAWEFPVKEKRVPRTFRAFVAANRTLLLANLSEARKKLEAHILDEHVLPLFGDVHLNDLTDRHLDQFLVAMNGKMYERREKKRTYSKAYINTVLRVLRKVLHRAVQYREIDAFPFLAKGKWAEEAIVKNELSDDERRSFLAAFDDRAGFKAALEAEGIKTRCIWGGFNAYYKRFAAMKPFFVCAMHTGLRRGDLLDLRWTDIRGDFIKRVMNKEKDRTADIPMSSTLKKTLAALPRRGAYVFHIDGRRPPLSTVKRYFQLAVRIAKIEHPFRFHDLRHTCGSTLASNGASLPMIGKILGHASTRTTERYAKPSEEALKLMAVFD